MLNNPILKLWYKIFNKSKYQTYKHKKLQFDRKNVSFDNSTMEKTSMNRDINDMVKQNNNANQYKELQVKYDDMSRDLADSVRSEIDYQFIIKNLRDELALAKTGN